MFLKKINLLLITTSIGANLIVASGVQATPKSLAVIRCIDALGISYKNKKARKLEGIPAKAKSLFENSIVIDYANYSATEFETYLKNARTRLKARLQDIKSDPLTTQFNKQDVSLELFEKKVSQVLTEAKRLIESRKYTIKDISRISYSFALLFNYPTATEYTQHQQNSTRYSVAQSTLQFLVNEQSAYYDKEVYHPDDLNDRLALPYFLNKTATIETSNLLIGYGLVPISLQTQHIDYDGTKQGTPSKYFNHDYLHLVSISYDRQTVAQNMNHLTREELLRATLRYNLQVLDFFNSRRFNKAQRKALHKVWHYITHELAITPYHTHMLLNIDKLNPPKSNEQSIYRRIDSGTLGGLEMLGANPKDSAEWAYTTIIKYIEGRFE